MNSDPISPTRVLCKVAALAANGLPTPNLIAITDDKPGDTSGSLNLTLNTIADARAWSDALGLSTSHVRETKHRDLPVVVYSNYVFGWHGWYVCVNADDPIGRTAEQIDADDPDLAVVLAEANAEQIDDESFVAVIGDGIDWRVECGLCDWTYRGYPSREVAQIAANNHEAICDGPPEDAIGEARDGCSRHCWHTDTPTAWDREATG